METSAPSQTSLMGLMRNLLDDFKRLLGQEFELAKAELSEKLSAFGRNTVSIAVGGFVAYAGLIVLLMGLGWLVAWALQKAGLQPVLAGFIGLAGVGIVVAVVGGPAVHRTEGILEGIAGAAANDSNDPAAEDDRTENRSKSPAGCQTIERRDASAGRGDRRPDD
jgi:hypothetical protein